MANFGQVDFRIFVSTASGSNATVRDWSQYVDTINGVKINGIFQQSDAFGDSWVEHLYVGVKRMDPLMLEGFYEDTAASGPHAVFGQTSDIGAERNFELNFGASDVVNGDVLIQDYERAPRRNELTRFRVTLLPTGTIGTGT